MVRISTWLGLFLVLSCQSLLAVEDYLTQTYNDTPTTGPTNSNIPNWQTGWQQPAVQPTGYTYTTGWNYVGSLAGSGAQASGVYLGYGWVITCAHVGPGNFTLNGTTYPAVPNTAQYIYTTSSGTTTPVDIVLFQVSPYPALPPLPLRTTDPVLGSSTFALIGYGDGGSLTKETWGDDTVNYQVNYSVTLLGRTLNDFATYNGIDHGRALYEVVSGDSGGANFIFNSSTGTMGIGGA